MRRPAVGDPFADIASVLRAVSHRVGSEIMVIGAHARDAVLAQLGAQPGRQTEDVDVVVGIPAGTSYRDVVHALGTPVNEKGYTFTVEGMPVDVLPSIDVPEEAARFSPARDIVLDVRGQAEAYASAMRVEVAHDCVVRVPTAEALALLKVIAWNVRRGQTSKDAKDLRALLGAMVERRLESDALLHDMGLSGPPLRVRDLRLAALRLGLEGR